MPGAAFRGLRHSESDVYFVRVTAVGRTPLLFVPDPIDQKETV